ncbi:hypothetical protein [Arthrobacter sp. AQ5-05]|uniref:hypothetical protein n=1 Tax=Arthrobacter sp. AQ5-05 TaxID=2184581 RepID=UPI0018A7279A|nr:hypothetical protein [Arthrobacter sp. AQ5-05]
MAASKQAAFSSLFLQPAWQEMVALAGAYLLEDWFHDGFAAGVDLCCLSSFSTSSPFVRPGSSWTGPAPQAIPGSGVEFHASGGDKKLGGMGCFNSLHMLKIRC